MRRLLVSNLLDATIITHAFGIKKQNQLLALKINSCQDQESGLGTTTILDPQTKL